MNFSGCEDGFATDSWFLLRATDESYDCEVPYVAFQVVASLLVIVQGGLLVVDCASIYLINSKKLRIQFFSVIVHGLIGLTFLILSLVDSSFGSQEKPLFWILYTLWMITLGFSTIVASRVLLNLSDNIQNVFGAEGLNRFVEEVNKKQYLNLVKVLFVISTFGIIGCWGVMISLTESADSTDWFLEDVDWGQVDEFWWRCGCGFLSTILFAGAFLMNTKLMILRKFFGESSSKLASGSGEDSPVKVFGEKVKKMHIVLLCSGSFAVILWLFHAIILKFYWYIAMLHFANSIIYQMLVVFMWKPANVSMPSRSNSKVRTSKTDYSKPESKEVSTQSHSI